MTEYDDLTKEILESQKWMAPPSWGIFWLLPNQAEKLEEIMPNNPRLADEARQAVIDLYGDHKSKPKDIRQDVIRAANHLRQAEVILRQVMQTTRKEKGPFKVSTAWSRIAQAKQALDRLLDATKE